MNLFILVWNYLKAKPLNTGLNLLILALGIAVITVLLLFNNQLERKISENARGIDLVVGAKGSPMQLILCNVFHIDFPTGNINLREAGKLSRNRLVKKAVPLALGDSYRGFRIVGTNAQFLELYHGEISIGKIWNETMEVTLGAQAALSLRLGVGDRFVGTHGMASGGHGHEERQFIVTGVLKPLGNTVDNLILTAVESVWAVHDAHGDSLALAPSLPSNYVPSPLVSSVPESDSTKEITSMLIQYRSAMGALQLPRMVNAQSSLQAASPVFEIARLFSILGFGADVLLGFAYMIIFISAISIFIALYNSLKERRYDMAIMRSMGASRSTLLLSILAEGCAMTMAGSIMGMVFGHGALALMGATMDEVQKAGIDPLVFFAQEWVILAGSLLLGLLCSALPAFQAYRTDISRVLAGN